MSFSQMNKHEKICYFIDKITMNLETIARIDLNDTAHIENENVTTILQSLVEIECPATSKYYNPTYSPVNSFDEETE